MNVATLHAVHDKGIRGQAPPREFKKLCNLVRFGRYLDQMFLNPYNTVGVYSCHMITLSIPRRRV